MNMRKHPMKIFQRRSLAKRILFPLWLVVAAALTYAADDEDFNWSDGAKFVDTFQFKQQFIDSLTAHYNVARPAQPLRTIPPHVFTQNEVLVYDVGWSIFKGGYVVLSVTPDTGTGTIRLGAKALSRGFVSTFYRMRDYIISTVHPTGLYPLFFEEHLREGKHYSANRWVLYNHADSMLYAQDKPVKVPPFTNDYISMIYVVRTRKFAPGDTFSLPFFVDGKLYRLHFSCSGRESIEFGGRNVPCLVTHPLPIDEKGVANTKKGFEIWFSDDAAKLPLKIRAKITIGSINANLIFVSRRMSRRPPAPKVVDTTRKADTAAVRDTTKKADSAVKRDSLSKPDTAMKRDSLKKADTGAKRDALSKPDTAAKRDTVKKADTGSQRDTLTKPDTSVKRETVKKADTGAKRDSLKKSDTAVKRDTGKKANTREKRNTPQKPDSAAKHESLKKADTGTKRASVAKSDTAANRTTLKKDDPARKPDTVRKK